MTTQPAGAVAVAAALRSATDLAGFSANRPSFYADPLAWLVAATVGEILGDCPQDALAPADEVGVVVVSSARSLPTARLIAESSACGRVSPLRFAGGNPGILAGLSCIQWRFRGPSMVLTAADEGGQVAVSAALALAGSWLAAGHARSVFCVRHTQAQGGGAHTVAAVLLRSDAGSGSGRPGVDPRALLVPAAANETDPAFPKGAL